MSCCERLLITSINSIISRTFSPNNIDRIACAVSEDICSNVNMLNELIQCRDGTYNLSNSLFDWDDIEQLIIFICTN